jgi:hypothetical protein
MLLPDGVHLTDPGNAVLTNYIMEQLGFWEMGPQFLNRGYGDRLYSNNVYAPGVTAREVGQRAGFTIQGHRDGLKQLQFLNESNEQVGALSFMPENAPGGEGNEFILSLGGVPSMKGTLYGGFSVGFNAPVPGAQFDIHNGNPQIIALRVNTPGVQEADLTRWNRGGTAVARLTNDGGFESRSLKVGENGGRISTILSGQTLLDAPPIPASTTVTWSLTVPGATNANNPSIALGWSGPLETELKVGQAWVSGADTISVKVSNSSAQQVDPAPITVRATVIQFVAP